MERGTKIALGLSALVIGGGLVVVSLLGGVPLLTTIFHRERADGVDPRLQGFLDWWAANGLFPITVLAGVRTNAMQAALWAKGRDPSDPGTQSTVSSYPGLNGNVIDPSQVVTNAATVDNTAHGHAGAIDAAPNIAGVVQDNIKDPATLAKFQQYGAAAKAYGLVWGGDFANLFDPGHVEVPDWKVLPVAGAQIAGLAALFRSARGVA